MIRAPDLLVRLRLAASLERQNLVDLYGEAFAHVVEETVVDLTLYGHATLTPEQVAVISGQAKREAT